MNWHRKNKRDIRELEQQRIEKLAELGAQLWLKRQEQGLSLEALTIKTRIQPHILHALEHAQLDKLPESIYIQGFIKQYADALGLNGSELSNNFPTGDPRLSIKPSWSRLSVAQLRPIHLYLLYIFIIICAVNALSHTLNRFELQVSRSQPQEKLFVPPDSNRDQVLLKESELKSVSATPEINKSVQISVTLKAESWIRVVADGKTQFEGFLPEGTQRTWIAKEQLTVRAGNAGGVLVTFNQEEKPKQMGDPGKVREVTLAANTRS